MREQLQLFIYRIFDTMRFRWGENYQAKIRGRYDPCLDKKEERWRTFTTIDAILPLPHTYTI